MPLESDRNDPRLVLKTLPPKASKATLPRPRLSLASVALSDKSVIAIHASPGYGKTALLVQWRREALASGVAVAWLGLDAQDDVPRLADGLMLAMQAGTRKPLLDHAFRGGATALEPFGRIANWLQQVAEFAGEVLLILDDVQALPLASHAALAWLLHHAPANLRVVLAARKPLPFSVLDLIARGQFASLDADDLRLQLAETTALLQARFGDRADADHCARLHQLTEGWVLGLQLAMVSIDKAPGFKDAVAACLSHKGDIRRFFVDSLLQRLDKPEMDFLVAVSFVDALHPQLCEAITGLTESAIVLNRLCEQTPILSEGVETSWLRIHALAKDVLLELFARLPEAERQRYHSAAAHWLADHGFYEEAARHAHHTGQAEMAIDLAERSLYEIYRTGQSSRITQWLDRFSAQQLEHRPRLRIALGWALAKIERNAEALAIVQPIIEDPLADISDRYEGILIVANAALYRDQLEVAQATLAPWRERFSGFSPLQILVTTIVEAFLAVYQGAPEQARYLLTTPSAQDSMAGRFATGGRDWVVAISYLWQGQVRPAQACLRTAIAEVEPIAGRRSPIACMLSATLGMALWESDELGEIDSLLADRRDVIDMYALPDVIAMSYVLSARMAVQAGSMPAAYELLERLFAMGEYHQLRRFCVISLGEQIRLAALQGRAQSCQVMAERLEAVVLQGQAQGWGMVQDLVGIQVGIAKAYVHMAHQRFGEAAQALAEARPLAEKLRCNKELLRIHLLLALAQKRLGQDAEPMFREILFIIDSLGQKRMLVDTHPDLVDWEQRVRAGHGGLARSTPVAQSTVPSAGQAAPEPRASAKVSPTLLLTPKERDIVGLLANNLSNKEIASALDLSTQTVKWHLKNLFAKLEAGSRKHLLDRARMLGILQ